MKVAPLSDQDAAQLREVIRSLADHANEVALLLGELAIKTDAVDAAPGLLPGAQALVACMGATADAAAQLLGADPVLGDAKSAGVCNWVWPSDLAGLYERRLLRERP